MNDPYRTLEPFPVAKFLDTPHALMGSKFKGELRVEADIAYKEGMGRLMLFSAKDDSRPIAVMVPAPVAKDIYFTKGHSTEQHERRSTQRRSRLAARSGSLVG